VNLTLLWRFGRTDLINYRLADWTLDHFPGTFDFDAEVLVNERRVDRKRWATVIREGRATIVFFRETKRSNSLYLGPGHQFLERSGGSLCMSSSTSMDAAAGAQLARSLCPAVGADQGALFEDPNCIEASWNSYVSREEYPIISPSYFTSLLRDREAVGYWISAEFDFEPITAGNSGLTVVSGAHGSWYDVANDPSRKADLEVMVEPIGSWSNDASGYIGSYNLLTRSTVLPSKGYY
jgi:hypothetical protein